MSSKGFGITSEGIPVTVYKLTNKPGVEMKVIDYGCTITSLKVPDREGNVEDIVLGFDTLEGYLYSAHYFGCLIGRCANRIAEGNFILNGQHFSLAKNHFPHHLHGGHKGFDKVVWAAREFQNEQGVGIDFHYLSLNGEEGYPGNLALQIRYFLGHDNKITFHYQATTDLHTIINLTQHSYFNLRGGRGQIFDHQLMIHADQFLPVNKTMIPLNEIKPVQDTPFDFKTFKMIGADIHADDAQIQIANGYDHTWIINRKKEGLTLAATLYESSNGRILEIYTTEPGLQLYTGNFLDNTVRGKNQIQYGPYSGLCLETQHYPDSPNHPQFPSIELKPGEKYESTTVWKFSLK